MSDLEAVPVGRRRGGGDAGGYAPQNGAYAGPNGQDAYQDQNVFTGAYGDDTLNGPLVQETYAGDGSYGPR